MVAPTEQPTDKQVVERLLFEMAAKNHQIQVMNKEIEDKLAEIMTVEILEKQQVIKDFYKTLQESLQNELDQISIEIRDLILQIKDKVKVEGVGQAIYVKPSAKWNNGKLEGLMIAYPQLEQAREWGSPSVRITFEK